MDLFIFLHWKEINCDYEKGVFKINFNENRSHGFILDFADGEQWEGTFLHWRNLKFSVFQTPKISKMFKNQ